MVRPKPGKPQTQQLFSDSLDCWTVNNFTFSRSENFPHPPGSALQQPQTYLSRW